MRVFVMGKVTARIDVLHHGRTGRYFAEVITDAEQHPNLDDDVLHTTAGYRVRDDAIKAAERWMQENGVEEE